MPSPYYPMFTRSLKNIFVAGCLLTPLFSHAEAIKVGMVEWIAYAPLHVAAEKGIWKELGVEVAVQNYSSNQDLNSALESGRIDIALDMLGSWVGLRQQGKPIVILGQTDWSNGGDKVIAKKGYDLKKLKGSSVGVYLNQPSVTYFLDQYLRTAGLGIQDVRIVELDPQPMTDNFIAGRMNLIVNYDPEAIRAEREGNGSVVATSASYPGVIPEGFATTTRYVQHVPQDTLVNFFRGWYRAVKWTDNPANWAAYQTILKGKVFSNGSTLSEADLAEMRHSVKVFGADSSERLHGAHGEVAEYLKRLEVFLKDVGELHEPVDASTLLAVNAISKAAALEK